MSLKSTNLQIKKKIVSEEPQLRNTPEEARVHLDLTEILMF